MSDQPEQIPARLAYRICSDVLAARAAAARGKTGDAAHRLRGVHAGGAAGSSRTSSTAAPA